MECRKHIHSWTARTSDILARSVTLSQCFAYCAAGTGSLIGDDLHMSLIHPRQLRAANSLAYLVEQQRLAQHLAARPEEWVPWSYRETIKRAKV
jgi:hypothetical protein